MNYNAILLELSFDFSLLLNYLSTSILKSVLLDHTCFIRIKLRIENVDYFKSLYFTAKYSLNLAVKQALNS